MVTGDELKRMKQGPPASGGGETAATPAGSGASPSTTRSPAPPAGEAAAQAAPPAAPEDAKPKLKWCDGCHRAVSKAFVCTRCQQAWYSSKDWQRAAWKRHKLVCHAVVTQASAEGQAALKTLRGSREEGADTSMDLSSAIACVVACSSEAATATATATAAATATATAAAATTTTTTRT